MLADQTRRTRPPTESDLSIKNPKSLFVVVGLVAVVLVALLALVLSPEPVAPAGPMAGVAPAQVAALEAAWGIRITNVAITANGGLIDLRFQVINPDKALGLLDPDDFPVLIDDMTGKILDKGGAHGGHAKSFKAGRTYYFLYQNNGSLLKTGSRITIQVGDVKLEHVIVR
jgi:hypothetical protein